MGKVGTHRCLIGLGQKKKKKKKNPQSDNEVGMGE